MTSQKPTVPSSNLVQSKGPRVVLSAIGRFHTFDLARQLHKRSALTAIFSGYPWFKLAREQLPRYLVYTFPWLHAPYMRLPGVISDRLTKEWEWWDSCFFEWYTALCLPNCDVYCGLSGSGLRSGIKAKLRGAKYVCDRGSSHIRFQDRILREEYDRLGIRFRGIDPRTIEQEEAEYAAADAITVPSTFAQRSFDVERVQSNKVKLISYGVDLSRFFPTNRPSDHTFDVLYVGAVSVRKGIPYLFTAFELLEHPNKRLTIVGGLTPELKDKVRAFASSRKNIRVLGHVPQPELKEYMSRAHVLVLPSIEEGLALVQAQAMSCGCPVIATTNTGAEDLFTNGVEGFIVGIRDPDAIAGCLQKLADDRQLRDRMGAAALARVREIGGWDRYGEQMYQLFCDLVR
jgi:starch synthase